MRLVACPHCGIGIEIIELNCCIFRCGMYRESGRQIHPHLPQPECERLKRQGEIYGCGRPFRVDVDGSGDYIATICDYL